MISIDIENTIVKFLNNQASVTEMEILEQWLDDPNNEKLFFEYIKVNYLIDVNIQNYDKSKFLTQLSYLIKNDQKKLYKMKQQKVLRYAAVFVIFISLVATINFIFPNQEPSVTAINEVVLKSENGLVSVLNPSGISEIRDRAGEVLYKKIDNSLIYTGSSSVKSLVYNTLTVPYGRKFSITLSDGTKVQLNSGTSIKFPVKFIKGQDRKVFIEYGEAFFDVAKDAKHPFVVNNNDINIKVLGTQFNVSAYPEDKAITTVLVEGAVQLFDNSNLNSKNQKNTIIKPGQQAVWAQNKRNFDVSKADIETHTGWLDGKIVLKSLPFKKMVVKLQRHYDVNITCNDEQLSNEIMTATFDEESIEEVLKLINEIHQIKYEMKGRNISIYKQVQY